MTPKKSSKQEKILYASIGAVCLIFVLFVLSHFFVCFNKETMDFNTGITLTIEHIQTEPYDIFPLPLGKLLVSLFIITLLFLLWQTEESRRKRMLPGKEEGSAKWNDNLKKYNKQYTSPKGKESNTGADNMIFTNDVFMSMNTRQTMRNNNVLVIGGSGAGKSRFMVKPNLLQANCSYVITDPSGELLESCAGFLEKAGYKIKIFNLVEMQYSDHYNPFNYIRNDEGVLMMINCLIQNTTPQGASKGDPFWEKSETALLLAICFYLHYEVRPEDRNFTNVMRLLLKAEVKEDQEDFKSTLDILFEELEEKNPSHIAVRYYKIFKMGAGKTLKSILISCTVRLGTFNLKAVQDLTSIDTIDLKTLGDEKQALFVVIPSADTTFNYLVSMMYSQLFETLYFHAENEIPSKRLPSHVRFMLDEFANIGTIPDFEKKLATMRKYEISCTIILQNLAQLKTMYKDAWESITGNCDSFLFLGGQEQTTLEYVSKKLGKRTILTKGTSNSKGRQGSHSESYNNKGRDLLSPDEISRMDNKNCILFIRGLFPFFGEKYDYPKHKNYKLTGDADSKQNYEYRNPERFLLPETKKNNKISKSNIKQITVHHDNKPHKTEAIPTTTQGGKDAFVVLDLNKKLIEDMGICKDVVESIAAIAGIEGFRADHEFYAADEFESSFLEESVEEIIEENETDMMDNEFGMPDGWDEPEMAEPTEDMAEPEIEFPEPDNINDPFPDDVGLPEEDY
ncbi:MAG: type IV secretory system conjugative DNA transfer family protein [Lachnospiraceae bacterium]|nr:type IV secretory system conjugative DNA transfer family protein [Lachnospiraceae bacterium]